MKEFDFEQINKVVLSKQHLADAAKTNDVARIVEDIGGLHAQVAATPYLSLFARSRSFGKHQLFDELYGRRSLAKIRCIRKTVYIQPTHLLPAFYAATAKMVRPTSKQYAQYLGVEEHEYERSANRILKMIAGRSMSAAEIKNEGKAVGNVSAIVNLMCDQGLLVRDAPRGGVEKQYPHLSPIQRGVSWC